MFSGQIFEAEKHMELGACAVLRDRTLRERISRIGAFFLLLLFSAFWSSTQLFKHIHVIDSVKVVHSHPYSQTQHTHTSAELFTISALDSAVLSDTINFELGDLLVSFVTEDSGVNFEWIISIFDGLSRLFRGPPSVCFIA